MTPCILSRIETMDRLQDLEPMIDRALMRDRFSLRKGLVRLRKIKDHQQYQQAFEAWNNKLNGSIEKCGERDKRRPQIEFSHSLPIDEKREEIQQALRDRQVIVVAGETGSGKSTQLPKIALQAGFGVSGMIGHTQPRRIAARSVAARIAEEMKVPLGEQVGFKVRFSDKSRPNTYIKLMTDGILLAESQSDRFFEQYEVIILDEAHERSLNIDFLLGYLRGLLPKRPELRLIITSATIDAERFGEHFADEHGPAPVIEVSGRSYPVDVWYRPLTDEEGDDREMTDGILAAAQELAAIDRGNMLVFLPTERDIREVARRIRGQSFPGDGSRQTEVLPLYARLSTTEQNRIFKSSDYRRIVLATNVAESSLTVPDIRYVIDTGTARISRYSPRSKVQRLPIEAVSRASADQRKGRCGRVAPGICIRLFEEDDYLRRDEFTTPEIRRTNLASVILQAKSLRLGEVDQIPFLDPPRPEAIRDGYKTLFEIGAVDERRELTAVGRELGKMPVDPRIGRMILAGKEESCLTEILIIAAGLEVQDPRERPHDRQRQADEQHEKFADKESDFLAYLRIWDFYHQLLAEVSRSQLRKACKQNYLSYNRMREWTEIHRQLLEMVGRRNLHRNSRKDEYAPIHRALLTGLLSGVAMQTGDREYTGAGGIKLQLWPGSGLSKERHKWIMAAELVETTRRYARVAARISPTWIEPIAEHLVKRTYSDPHWHRKTHSVMAYEKVNLFGLPVVSKRRMPYGRIDPVVSRKVFIEGALVDQRGDLRERFYRANRRVRDEIAELAAKTRRREYLLDDYSIYRFYDERVPDDVLDGASLRRWIKKSPNQAKRLMMKVEDLVDVDESHEDQEAFPENMQVGAMKLPVEYHFQVDSQEDGVTITVPATAIGQLTSQRMGWLVPGLLEEKVVALIRSLPKSLRRNFVPVPDTAREVASQLDFGQGDLLESLAAVLQRRSDDIIRAADFDLEKIPTHLNINVRVVNDDGDVQQSGRDLDELLQQVQNDDSSGHEETFVDERWMRDGIVAWDFEQLPTEISTTRGGIQVPAFPTLVDGGESVQLRLSDTSEKAVYHNRRGLTRLLCLEHRKSLRVQVQHLPRWDDCCVWAASVLDPDSMKRQLQDRIAELAFFPPRQKLPKTREEYEAVSANAIEKIAVATQEVTPLIPKLFEAFHKTRLALESVGAERWDQTRNDVQQQLNSLFQDEFLRDVPWFWMQQFPRYLAGIAYRIDKLTSGGESRDQQGRQEVDAFWSQYREQSLRNSELGRVDPQLEEYRWMIEEFRVSLFAQPLGTAVKVSPQRLEKQWDKVIKNA